MLFRKWTIVPVAIFVCGAYGQVIPKGSGYLFRALYKTGRTVRYTVTTRIQNLQLKGKPIDTHMTATVQVVNASRNVSTLKLILGSTTLNGNLLRGPSSSIIQVNPVNDAKGHANTGNVLVPFPLKAVRVGEKWSSFSSFPMGPQGEAATVTTDYWFQGIEGLGGKRLAILKLKMFGIASGNGKVRVDMSDGSLYRSESSLAVHTASQGDVPVVLTVQRVK